MKQRTAEKIMGLEIRKTGERSWAAFEGEAIRAEAAGKKESAVMSELVEMVYEQRRKLVFERDNFRCVMCGRFGNLTCHHKVYRAHGRNDSVDNLCTLCISCHRLVHDGVIRLQ